MLSDVTCLLTGSHGELAVVALEDPAACCGNGAIFCIRIFRLNFKYILMQIQQTVPRRVHAIMVSTHVQIRQLCRDTSY